MTELRRFQAVDAVLLLAILAGAFAVRAGYLLTFCTPQHPSGWLQVQDTSPLVPGKKDVTELSELYHNFKEDKGFASRAPARRP